MTPAPIYTLNFQDWTFTLLWREEEESFIQGKCVVTHITGFKIQLYSKFTQAEEANMFVYAKVLSACCGQETEKLSMGFQQFYFCKACGIRIPIDKSTVEILNTFQYGTADGVNFLSTVWCNWMQGRVPELEAIFYQNDFDLLLSKAFLLLYPSLSFMKHNVVMLEDFTSKVA